MKWLYSAALRNALVVAAIAVVWTASRADAQSYPSRPIRLIVPASVSTPPDIVSRIVVNALNESEGWTIVVENKPGGAQLLGTREALKQPADGYTLLTVGFPLTVAQSLVPDAGFNLSTDFAPIAQLVTTGNVLVVNPDLPVKTVAELVQYLKDNPDKGTFSSGGVGTPAHIIGELFKLKTGVRTTHVPYSEFPRAIADLLQGVNTYQFIAVAPVLGFINTGKLRALAVTPARRMAQLPDVPTLAEAGFPELTSFDWVGLAAKAGTPPAVIARPQRRGRQGAQRADGGRSAEEDRLGDRRRHAGAARRPCQVSSRVLGQGRQRGRA